jgi:hypothetical protein
VLALDLRGLGETAPGPPPKGPNDFGADAKEAFLALHLDRPLLGQRVLDVLLVLVKLMAEEEAEEFDVVGVGDGAGAGVVVAVVVVVGAVVVEVEVVVFVVVVDVDVEVLVLGDVVLVDVGVGVVTTDAGMTGTVGSEAANVVPFLFVAMTTKRSVELTSALTAVYVVPVAPPMALQLAPTASQRFHWYVYDWDGPSQLPEVPFSVAPTCGVPVIVGTDELVGAD